MLMMKTCTLLLVFLALVKAMLRVDDILDEGLMPTSLLLLGEERTTSSFLENQDQSTAVGYNGSWHDAYVTMGFHRKMLNEYLCRNFLAEEIITQVKGPLISKRSGRPFAKPEYNITYKFGPKRQSTYEKNNIKESLLADPGSSNYRDWLTKTATLEDIYRHYEKDRVDMREDLDDFDGGEITGYAMQDPGNDPPYPMMPNQEQSDEKHGGEYDFMPHHVHFHGAGGGEDEKSHHMQLNDIFDVALTALAFLSFGMFILQVIMCITSNKPNQTMQMMMPPTGVSGTAPGTAPGGTGPGATGPATGPEQFTINGLRFKRDVMVGTSPIDELSRKVLISIEAGLAASEDDGVCLKRVLCENNKYSRKTDDGRRLWIPVWGLGMSWLSSKLIPNQAPSAVMLDSLKACALGLALSDCGALYSRCNTRHLLAKSGNSGPGVRNLKGDVG